jgi:hypothetical protein
MADLLDIAPATATAAVRIRGERIVVRGLNGNDVASIVSRFPHIGKLFDGGLNEDRIQLLVERLGVAVGPVIAAGCGHVADEKYEHVASANLTLEEQVMLFGPIWGLTFPNGIRSFIETMTRVMYNIAGAGEGAKKIKLRLKQSPSASPPSSDADSHPTMQ